MKNKPTDEVKAYTWEEVLKAANATALANANGTIATLQAQVAALQADDADTQAAIATLTAADAKLVTP